MLCFKTLRRGLELLLHRLMVFVYLVASGDKIRQVLRLFNLRASAYCSLMQVFSRFHKIQTMQIVLVNESFVLIKEL